MKRQTKERLNLEKEQLQKELIKIEEIYGLTHPLTVAKSQELDIILDEYMFHLIKEKGAE